MSATRPTRAGLAAEVERLEARCRSLEALLERAEQDRDTALMRLSTCAEENGIRRHLLAKARAALSEAERVAGLERAAGQRSIIDGGGP